MRALILLSACGAVVVEHVDYDGDRVGHMFVTGQDMTGSSSFDYVGCRH